MVRRHNQETEIFCTQAFKVKAQKKPSFRDGLFLRIKKSCYFLAFFAGALGALAAFAGLIRCFLTES